MIYVTSDHHFGHKNIIEYENRPFDSVPEMDAALITLWNEVVKPDDLVIHLGDFIMGSKERAIEITRKLNGKKIIVKGNHDTHSNQWYLDCGFIDVFKSYCINVFDKKILFTHRPTSIPDDYRDNYDLHFYGHVHGKNQDCWPTIASNGACCCVERWNYTPISLEFLVNCCNECMDKKFVEVVSNV